MAPAGADGPHVLLVENDEMVRGCLVDLLREAGLRVAVASSAAEALGLFEAAGDLAVLVADVHLGPGMDGIRLAAAARCRWPRLRAVLISGDVEVGDRVLPASDHFLPKPFRAAELVRAVCGDDIRI